MTKRTQSYSSVSVRILEEQRRLKGLTVIRDRTVTHEEAYASNLCGERAVASLKARPLLVCSCVRVRVRMRVRVRACVCMCVCVCACMCVCMSSGVCLLYRAQVKSTLL